MGLSTMRAVVFADMDASRVFTKSVLRHADRDVLYIKHLGILYRNYFGIGYYSCIATYVMDYLQIKGYAEKSVCQFRTPGRDLRKKYIKVLPLGRRFYTCGLKVR